MKNNKLLIGILILLSVLFVVVLILFLNKPSYEVQFVSDNMVIDTVKVKRKERVDRPSNPVKEGYVFVDWYLNGSAYDFSTQVTGNMTLTALWNVEEILENEIVITLNTDGGNILSPIKINKGEKITKPEDPTKEGYKFLGWYYKLDNEEKEFDFETEVTENIELYAKWEKVTPVKSSSSSSKNDSVKSYTVKFDTDGGSKVSSQTIKENGKVIKPSDPTKSGYKFREWRLNGVTYDFSKKVTKNITLTAIWDKATVDVTGVQLSCSTLKMIIGEEKKLTAVVKPTNATDRTVTWKSSNTSVATVSSSGTVTAIGEGSSTITATAGDKKATCIVTVVKPASSSSSEPPASSSEPEQPVVTYSVRWEKDTNSSMDQYRLYIMDSNGQSVSGRVRIYFNDTSLGSVEVDVPTDDLYPSAVYNITKGDIIYHN